MYINIIDAYRTVIAIADDELIGKVFYEGILQLDVKESFYKGQVKSKEEIMESLRDWAREDATFNIVGKESIATAVEAGIISEDSIGYIDNIPYAMILL